MVWAVSWSCMIRALWYIMYCSVLANFFPLRVKGWEDHWLKGPYGSVVFQKKVYESSFLVSVLGWSVDLFGRVVDIVVMITAAELLDT